MSIPLPRAILLVLLFLTGNFLIQAGLTTVPDSAFKLLLCVAFILPLIPVFYLQKLSPGRFFRRDPERFVGAPTKELLTALPIAVLVALCLLILGTELLNYTREWLAAEEQYQRMMGIISPTGATMDVLGAYLTIGLLGPLCEELLFRGLLLRGIERAYRPRGGVALAVHGQALLFALVHMNQFQFPYTLGAGIVLGWLAWWTGSIVLPLVVHAGINTTQITILYFFPETPWFAYKGPGVIEHLPWWVIVAGAIGLGVLLTLVRRGGLNSRRESPLTH